jgi:hypothetical protein
MATKARGEVNGQKNDPRKVLPKGKAMVGEQRAGGAHEALPQTPPGGKPPETPTPFPSGTRFQNGGNPSRVRKPRNTGAPLTDTPPF